MRSRNLLIERVGINDADYSPAKINCPYYSVWCSMLKRCYNETFLLKNPTYVDCSVCSEWHLFTAFKAWMESQSWQGKQLDKDLRVPGNRLYGPKTCLFVSHQVNGLLATQPKQGGQLPMGVTRHGDRFKATLKKQKKTIHAGVFDTPEEAATAYGLAKAAWIEYLASKENCPITKSALLRAAQNYRGIL